MNKGKAMEALNYIYNAKGYPSSLLELEDGWR
jgi:hypothetical protein